MAVNVSSENSGKALTRVAVAARARLLEAAPDNCIAGKPVAL